MPFKDNAKIVKKYEVAPTIVGRWQKVNHYIPCRIFKNISYGKLGITNPEIIKELFDGNVVFKESSDLMGSYLQLDDISRRKMFHDSVMLVKEKHTFINRINTILDLIT